MTEEILSSWKQIANHLGVSVSYAKSLAKRYEDFPVFRDHRIFTTKSDLLKWIKNKINSDAKITLKNL